MTAFNEWANAIDADEKFIAKMEALTYVDEEVDVIGEVLKQTPGFFVSSESLAQRVFLTLWEAFSEVTMTDVYDAMFNLISMKLIESNGREVRLVKKERL